MSRHVYLTLALCVCVLVGSDPAFSQEAPTVFYGVGYMKVAPEKVSEYLDLEQKTWKPVHQQRLEAGTIVGWDLYAVRFPGGTEAPCQFVTVNIYDDLAKVEAPFSEELVKRAHPGVDMEDFSSKTLAARDLVRSELWIQRDVARPDAEGIKVGDYLTVGYMKVPPGGGGAYLRMEREIYKPIHQARITDGWIHNWGVNQLFLPGGSGGDYNWATVQVYKEFGKLLGGNSQEIFEKAHPGLAPSMLQSANDLRDMVRVDLWELIDQVR
jgi:hypothetical protein